MYNLPELGKNFSIFKYVLILFLGWKVALLFITYFGLSTFPSQNGIDNFLYFPSPDINYWFRWSNWDGGHFRGIVENGYLPSQTVFFPLYPALMKLLNLVGLNITFAGLLISNISLIAVLFFLYKLTLLDFKEAVAKRAVFALLIFPTSFYFGALYSESLFLAVTLAAFYLTRINYKKMGALFTAAAVATRLVGITTVIAILSEHLLKKSGKFHIGLFWNTKLKKLLIYFVGVFLSLQIIISNIIPFRVLLIQGILSSLTEIFLIIVLLILALTIIEFLIKNLKFKNLFSKTTLLFIISFSPIILYMIYQQIIFANPFSFLTNEVNWQRHFSAPYQPVLNYINYFIAAPFQIGYSAKSLTELIFFISGLIGLFFSFYKLRPAYSIYFLLGLFLPTFSGTLIAMPRYMLTIFPIFILLGLVENEYVQKIGSLIFILLLSAFSVLFINWYWVT